MSHICYISIGTNLGNRLFNAYVALAELEQHVRILGVSSFYESDSWGYQDEKRYINFAVKISTTLSPLLLLSKLKLIELNMGRDSNQTGCYEARVIDLDIVFFNNYIINHQDLTIPHPKLYNRRFVLVPVYELNSSLLCPLTNKNISDILDNAEDDTCLDLYTQ